MLRDAIRVSAESLNLAFGWVRADAHTTLSCTTPWRDDEAQRDADRRALAEFAALGVAGPRGLEPDFEDTVGALARPQSEFYGWIGTPESSVSALAAVAGVEAVLAIKHGDSIILRPARREGLAEELVGLLPRIPAAHGQSVNIRESDMPTGAEVRAELRTADSYGRYNAAANPDVAQLNKVLTLPRTGGGKLYTALRDRNGRRHRYPHPLAYLDTPEGRWITQAQPSRGGETWIIAAPASPEWLVNRLYDQQRTLS